MAKYWIVFLAVVAAACGGYAVARKFKNERGHTLAAKRVVYSGPRLTDFMLTDQNGRTFDSRSQVGEVTLTSFFFTACPAICLRMNRALVDVQPSLSDDVRLISISCDPETDTPGVLKSYAKALGADQSHWAFLTGDLGYIERIAKDLFGFDVGKLTHSDRVIVSDRAGKVCGSFQVTDPNELRKMQALLGQLTSE